MMEPRVLETMTPHPHPAMPLPELYARVERHVPPVEWPLLAEDIAAILALKRAKNAVILAHNYQTPDIFHTVGDITGDSLALAREAARTDAAVIVLAESVKVNGLRRLDAQDGMPPLPDVDLMLWRREPGALPAADHLAAYIVKDVGSGVAREL